MNVLVVIGHKQKLGAIRMMMALGKAIKERSVDFYYVTENVKAFANFAEFEPARTFQIARLTDWRNLVGRVTCPLTVYRLARVARECRADIIYAHHLSTFPIVWMASKLTSIPHIVVLRNMYPDIVGQQKKFMLARARDVLSVSHYIDGLAGDFFEAEKRTVRRFVVHNGIDVDAFNALSARGAISESHRPPNGNVVVGMVSVMSPGKNPHFLLRAAQKVIAKYPDVTFMFMGNFPDSEYERDTRGLISSLHLERNVIFTGFQKDIAPYFAGIDILAHPSLRDAFPLALLEAMSLAKPVVAHGIGGIPEIVAHGETGFLTEPEDISSFSEALLQLISDRELRTRMGHRAKQRVEEFFGINKTAEGLASVFHEIHRMRAEA